MKPLPADLSSGHRAASAGRWVVSLDSVGSDDVDIVGGKCASLGEMTRELSAAGVPVPDGFAVTAGAYWAVVELNDLGRLIERLAAAELSECPGVAQRLHDAFRTAVLPDSLADQIRNAYEEMTGTSSQPIAVAVRSSATAEDLPTASFAGQHESFLGVEGADDVVAAYRSCLASLFTDRAVGYRQENNFDHRRVALSVGVQRMVRSDLGSSGVMFTLDPDNGFDGVIVVDAVWGLGEPLVGGVVEADRYRVLRSGLSDPSARPVLPVRLGSKAVRAVRGAAGLPALVENSESMVNSQVLSSDAVLRLARWAVLVEEHFGAPVDMEWACDGLTGEMWIVQARPETVQSQRNQLRIDSVTVADSGPVLASGRAVGTDAATGTARVLNGPEDGERFLEGDVLVAAATDPDWVPVMRRAAAVVTNRGGGTSHAAIVCRELGTPAVLGCGNATEVIADGLGVTVSCAYGPDGTVTEGISTLTRTVTELSDLPVTRTRVLLNLADPDAALRWWALPAAGIGLVRMEFIIAEQIGVHPMALAHPERVADLDELRKIDELVGGRAHGSEWFVERLAAGLAMLCAVASPGPAVVRLSDFKTNEYARLLGGQAFEPEESNPMLGWRGASRYADPGYRDGFSLECRALRRVREVLGQSNLAIMVPFCRTPEEADTVLAVLASEGLVRGEDGLQIWLMAEIPSNIIRAEEFAERCDGFSIGSNDLTQLTLGVDRESEVLADRFGPDDPAVLRLIHDLIQRAHAVDTPVSFCGQAPSNDPTYARRLVEMGIDSISVTPDSFVAVTQNVAAAESS